MKTKNVGDWQNLRFIFPDNSAIAFNARLSDAVIKELALETGQPVFKLKCFLDEFYQPNSQIFASGFPYNDLWFRYAQILAIEKQGKIQTHISVRLLRVIFFEYLRIAESIFDLATISLTVGLNDIFFRLMQEYHSLRQYFEQILNGINPMDFINGNKIPKDLPVGFTEMTLNLSHQIQIQLRKSLPRLFNNRLILSRLRKIADHIADNLATLNTTLPPNNDSIYDCRYTIPHSLDDKFGYDRTQFPSDKKQNNVFWQLLKKRYIDLFQSIDLIRQSLTEIVYLDQSPQRLSSVTSLPIGNSSVTIATPWGELTCRINCPGNGKPCDFTLSNPLYKIRLLLCEMAVGLELDELPLLIALLGLRPKIKLKIDTAI